MLLLKKKQDIDKEKKLEQQKEIESGVALATRIDKLRITKDNEERQLKVWRDSSLKAVQLEIDQELVNLENLRTQNKELESNRLKLLEPLDKEWEEINKEKENLKVIRSSTFLEREQSKIERIEIKREQELIVEARKRLKDKEFEKNKTLNETIQLNNSAKEEYQTAKVEHEVQNDNYEQKMIELDKRSKEYDVAMSGIEVRENQVKDKESELITREQALERRLKRIQGQE